MHISCFIILLIKAMFRKHSFSLRCYFAIVLFFSLQVSVDALLQRFRNAHNPHRIPQCSPNRGRPSTGRPQQTLVGSNPNLAVRRRARPRRFRPLPRLDTVQQRGDRSLEMAPHGILRLAQFGGGDADVLPDVGRSHSPGRAGHLRAGEVLLVVAGRFVVGAAGFGVRRVARQSADTRHRLSGVSLVIWK